MHCFQFHLAIIVVPREIEDSGYAIFVLEGGGGGVNKVHYGLCKNGELPKFRNITRRNAEQGTQTGDFSNQPLGKNVARFFWKR